jgi:steroid 5-alpha reductase family enzyme
VSWGPLLVNLAVTAGLVAVLMLATFLYAMRTRVHAIMDTIWPLGFVLIAVVSFVLSAGSGVTGRRVLVLVLTAVWGLRLLACSHWLGLVLVASPVYMTNMLVRHTGKRLLEKHMARSKGAAYAEYVRRTSGFIPRPPR